MYIDRSISSSTSAERRGLTKARLNAVSVQKVVAAIGLALILVFLLTPTLIILPMSVSTTPYLQFPPEGLTLHWYEQYLSDPDWLGATWFSLRVALATSVTATIIGTLTALALAKGDLPFAGVVQAISISPLIVPHVVLGVALYLVFSPLHLTGTFVGFLVSHTVLSVPFVVISVTSSLQRIDPVLELAALNCGANRFQTFWHVTLPNISTGIASGAVFAFLASFDEATVAFFISDIGGKPIGRKMFEDIDFNLSPVIAAASSVIVVASLVLIGLMHLLSAARTNKKQKGQQPS